MPPAKPDDAASGRCAPDPLAATEEQDTAVTQRIRRD
jgi:hypothetical protein